jgi:hypothetical protein
VTKDRIFRWPAKKIVRWTSTVTLHELSYLKNSIVHRRDTIETVTTSVVQWLTCLPGVWKIMGPDQKLWNYREGAILQSPCPLSVRSHFRNISQLLLEEMILYLIYGFGMVTCTVSPLSRFTTHLLPVYRATYKWTSGGILSMT